MKDKIFNNPDLHMHSVFSDGTDTPEEILRKVKENNIDIFSLTDHDSYKGCGEVMKVRTDDDPYFIGGVEFSCKDESGKYHILGYCYDVNKTSIIDAVNYTHNVRKDKAIEKIEFIENKYGFKFSDEEKDAIFKINNPGKPHFAKILVEKGYEKSKDDAITALYECKTKYRELTPEAAIDAILKADGIPVLAHGILADGRKHLSVDEIEERVYKLKDFGLMGLECYYSSYTEEEKEIMLYLAQKYNLLITAGSDYHGKNKKVKLGETNNPDKEKMSRFYKVVYSILEG